MCYRMSIWFLRVMSCWQLLQRCSVSFSAGTKKGRRQQPPTQPAKQNPTPDSQVSPNLKQRKGVEAKDWNGGHTARTERWGRRAGGRREGGEGGVWGGT